MSGDNTLSPLKKLLRQYSATFHEPYYHAGEEYPDSVEGVIADISHWLEIGKPRPWADYPDGWDDYPDGCMI
ncbi:hypothetical protein [Bifidobacterium simiarum]|uniref:hypothetical protein n=1 Tax=Bifidobacterium simiarum TaxID=2045441 RepID=UPI001BDC535D|nr:hypothetical protein [Bifidobacterium simiarum]MBT1166885.1 hypothetical protein [Bifidobacterium simiarum]